MESTVGMALPTIAIIVCMFFLGMGLGVYVCGNAGISSKWAGRLYIVNQISLALLGLIFVATDGLRFVCLLTTDSEKWLLLVYFLRIITISLFLLAPAFFFGAAFSLLKKSKSMMTSSDKAEKLYLANLGGSTLGAILIGFIMLPNFSLTECTVLAMLLNLFSVPFFVLAENLRMPSAEISPSMSANQINSAVLEITKGKKRNAWLFVLAIMAAAFFNMLLELLFIRLSVLYIGCSAFAFSLVLAMQLLALAWGSFLANFLYKQKIENFLNLFVFLYFIASLWLLIEILFFPNLGKFIDIERSFWTYSLGWPSFLSFCFSHSIFLLLFMFVPCACLGACLPFYFQLRHLCPSAAPIKSSHAFALNLFASVVGCFSGGVLIFPIFSSLTDFAISLAFILSALAICSIGLLIYIFDVLHAKNNKQIGLSGFITIIFLALCYWHLAKRPLLTNGTELLFYREGLNSTVSLAGNERENLIRLQTDGQTEATLPLNESLPSAMSDETTQVLLGLLPNIFSLREPKAAFLIGFGSGVTAQALLTNSSLEDLTAAELEPAVLAAAQHLKRYVPDRRLNVKITDGRNLLSMLNHSYDIIVSQAGEPWRSSSRYLYTSEFWQLAKSRLVKDGVFCQWLPLYAIDKGNLMCICHTFATVFPDTFVIRTRNAGELILLAYNSNGERKLDSLISMMMRGAIQCCKLQGIRRGLIKLGFNDLPTLLSIFRLDPDTFLPWVFANENPVEDRFKFNTDNFPFVQYRLQSLIMQEGIGVNIFVDKALPNTLIPGFFRDTKNYPRIILKNFLLSTKI